MAAAKQIAFYTIDDILNLPDGQRAELIDGELYMMATPSTNHQRLVMDLSYRIKDFIQLNRGSCEVFPSPFAVFLNADDSVYVEPDIVVICDKTKLTDKGCYGTPDWIIEIVSPSSRSMDYYKKLFQYRMAGVREYWIVDPDKKLIMVYRFERDLMESYTFSDWIKVGIYENFEIDFSEFTIRENMAKENINQNI